jgi:uridine phosphorylase
MKRAWYLGATPDDVAPSAVLIGDPGRIDRLAQLLDEVRWIGQDRMLRTITGLWQGRPVTAAAFGIGGPIAAIVMHELFDLGVRNFLRMGMAMSLPPVRLGDFVIGCDALCRDGTSQAYLGPGKLVGADPELCPSLATTLAAGQAPWQRARFASFDGFYQDMFALDMATAERVARIRVELIGSSVHAIDMESAALFAAAARLGARAATLSVASVDSMSRAKVDATTMLGLEHQLLRFGLDALNHLTRTGSTPP